MKHILTQYNVYSRDTKNASGKAKDDVSDILFENGFKRLYNPSKYRLIRILQQFVSILIIPKGTILFIQYKANLSFFYYLLRYKKGVKKIAIIHDLESLRGFISVKDEVKILNSFQFIISHNYKMTSWLKKNNVRSFIIELGIFDYLLDESIKCKAIYKRNSIFFAGNMSKSLFLIHLHELGGLKFYIYGAQFDGIKAIVSQENVIYKGSFNSNQLIKNVEGGWGLVWDGDSLETCSGVAGEYMRYNNPHKVSMCIVSERPIIIWSQAAMADYITNKKLGVVVDNLYDLPNVLQSISNDEYQKIIQNVREEKKRLVNGQNLTEALDSLLKK